MAKLLKPATVKKRVHALQLKMYYAQVSYQKQRDSIKESLDALRGRCPHKNLRLLRSGSKKHRAMCDALGDESSMCMDCGASGTSPASVGK